MKRGWLLIRASGAARLRVVTLEDDGSYRPRTSWCKTHTHVQKVINELQREGWTVEDLTEGEAKGAMASLFAEEKFERKTRNGFPFDEVASALQKCIRRGEEELALYWALELERSGFYKYVWKRLTIIASEDVGLGDPMAAVMVSALRQSYLFIRENTSQGEVDWNELAEAVLYLCRAGKNREVNEYANYVGGMMEKPEVPDYAVDKHTKRGRAMGRTNADFWREGAKVHPKVGESKYAKFFPRAGGGDPA